MGLLLSEVVLTSAGVAATPKRSEKVSLIADLIRRAAPTEIAPLIGLLVGEIRQGRLGIGWATLGELRIEPAAEVGLEIAALDRAFARLAVTGGVGSQRSRGEQMADLYRAATADEQRFIQRVLAGDLRQGANAGVVTDAVAKASGRPLAAVRRAAMLLGDLGAAAELALGGADLDAIGLSPLTGVQPMLASTAASVSEALIETGAASVEWKLDGARVQVHRSGDEVRVFTRTLHEISGRVPEIVSAVRALPAQEFVLDGEALGLDLDGNPLKFQDSMNSDSALRPFFFDALQAEGTSLIDEPLSARKTALRSIVPTELLLPTIDIESGADPMVAEQFADDAIAAGHEGVMVKGLESTYQAGRRGATWRKVKPVHTLDLVVLAAEWGYGRRTGWLSNIHLGARGSDGSFVMVGKTFKGMTDALLRWQTEEFQRIAIGTAEEPTGPVVHVRPEHVVEIAVDGVQRSTRYPGGVALRFARVKRYRADKRPSEADTIERVQAML
ncbi:MAG: ATP-dependent DNA ligase [Ilumatobacteraceae bacterium]